MNYILLLLLFFNPLEHKTKTSLKSFETLPKKAIKEIEKQFNIHDLAKQGNIFELHIEQKDLAKGKFYTIKKNVSTLAYLYDGRVNTCRKGGCSNPHSDEQFESSEFFDYFILFDTKKIVRSVVVYNYEATHGQEITTKGFLKQFIGYEANKTLKTGKNIDAISGATISVESITKDIQANTKILQTL